MPQPQTKLARLRQLMAEGDCVGALHLAAGWPRLGKHRDAIQRGWAAADNPRFYLDMDEDPGGLIEAGIDALCERYNIQIPKSEDANHGNS